MLGHMVAVLSKPPPTALPPLRNGDNLTREEFERRWDLHPEIKHAELIDGLVYLEVTVGWDHGSRHILAGTWLGAYWGGRAGLQVCDNSTVRLPDGSEVQPDLLLRITEEAGGRSGAVGGLIEGPPEFVFEVSASSAGYDLHQKFNAYERNGIREYVVWQLHENRLDWFVLREGRFEIVEPDASGVVESVHFPGLRLNVPMLLTGDLAGILRGLAAG